ncbi:MAG: CPBP family intramembrane metalloprotease [Bacteroidota bacterium]|nr:CPBP family intramembrane metalloprotease [Bacteroidota bacterium]
MARKGESVTSSIGASINGLSPSSIFPIFVKFITFAAKILDISLLMNTGPLSSFSPSMRLLFVVMLVIVCYLIFFLGGIFLAIPLFHVNLVSDFSILTNFNDPRSIVLMKYFQVLQSVAIFIAPALLAGWFFEGNPGSFLKANRSSSFMIFLCAFLVILTCLPLINELGTLNEKMKLPAGLGGFEQWMKDMEDEAGQITDAFMNTTTAGGFLFNLFMIAILPALGEEMFFRGVLQKLLGDWFRNRHIAIFVTALIFAGVHLQFYGFLPRFFLGLMLGYLFFWSGSLWVPILAHFINNSSAVFVDFLNRNGLITTKYEDFGNTDNAFLIIGSIVVTGLLFYFIYRKRKIEPVSPVHDFPY